MAIQKLCTKQTASDYQVGQFHPAPTNWKKKYFKVSNNGMLSFYNLDDGQSPKEQFYTWKNIYLHKVT
jgi:hypothetical protein